MNKRDVNTVELLERVRAGDAEARDRLVEHELLPLLRYTRGRVPACVRSVSDNRDLVHDVMLRLLPKLDSFRPDGPGGLQAFLRRAVSNQIIDALRRSRRRPECDRPLEAVHDGAASPLAQVIAIERRKRVRAALAALSPSDRALIVGRFNGEREYADLARECRRPTANAARVALKRALLRLAKAVQEEAEPPSLRHESAVHGIRQPASPS